MSVRIFVIACSDIIPMSCHISRISYQGLSGALIQTKFGNVEVHAFQFIHNEKRSERTDNGLPWQKQAHWFLTQIEAWYDLNK